MKNADFGGVLALHLLREHDLYDFGIVQLLPLRNVDLTTSEKVL